jgi:predicted solute-binding protein
VAQAILHRLGCVKYLNARPLVRGWSGHVQFDHPSSLCRQLDAGELEVALVSSFEFLRNPIYRIVDGVAIGSDGPVYSVVVASEPGSKMREIEIDPASATAVSLLRVLLIERNRAFIPLAMPADKLSPLRPGVARFLIGDQAIEFRQKFGVAYDYWDLGGEWQSLTTLPFVFALWLIRPEVRNATVLADSLRKLRDANLADLEGLIAERPDFDAGFCRAYYLDHVRFDFGDKEKEGLDSFERLCVKNRLLPGRSAGLTLV